MGELCLVRMGIQVRGLSAWLLARRLRWAIAADARRAMAASAGLLESQAFTIGINHFGFLQYWRSFEELDAWSRREPHSEWWRAAVERMRRNKTWAFTMRRSWWPRTRVDLPRIAVPRAWRPSVSWESPWTPDRPAGDGWGRANADHGMLSNMGYWGVKSYENDDADDALDAGFDRVHGPLYEELMDDRNPLSFEQVQKRLADGRTLAAAVSALEELAGRRSTAIRSAGTMPLAYVLAGVVVRHAELGVAIPENLKQAAIGWLEQEDIDWEEATKRRLRRQKEIELLRRTRETPRLRPTIPGDGPGLQCKKPDGRPPCAWGRIGAYRPLLEIHRGACSLQKRVGDAIVSIVIREAKSGTVVAEGEEGAEVVGYEGNLYFAAQVGESAIAPGYGTHLHLSS